MVLVTKRSREFVRFDASNPEHRQEYKRFRDSGSWKMNKYTFDLEFPYETIPHLCTSKLLEFYLESDKALK